MGDWRRKRCSVGKACSAACIQRTKVCLLGLPEQSQGFLGKARNYVTANSSHLADHLGKGLTAWKTGKVLGTAVSSYLESRYNIPRELSQKLSETVIQGLAATAFDVKNLSNSGAFVRKLTTEIAAAFVGKSSHSGVESYISSKEVESVLGAALPVLAGKLSGIGTAVLTSRIPSPRQMLEAASKRSAEDIAKVKQLLEPRQLNFKELTFPVDLLGDLAIIALYGAKKSLSS